MTCPVAGSPGSGAFIATVIELGFFITDTTSALLTFGGMYFDHDGCICKHCYIINTSIYAGHFAALKGKNKSHKIF